MEGFWTVPPVMVTVPEQFVFVAVMELPAKPKPLRQELPEVGAERTVNCDGKVSSRVPVEVALRVKVRATVATSFTLVRERFTLLPSVRPATEKFRVSESVWLSPSYEMTVTECEPAASAPSPVWQAAG